MTTDPAAALKKLGGLLEKASPLPWRSAWDDDDENWSVSIYTEAGGIEDGAVCSASLDPDDGIALADCYQDDAAYIIEAANNYPDCLRTLARLQPALGEALGEVRRLQDLIDRYAHAHADWLAADPGGSWNEVRPMNEAHDALLAAATPRQPEDPTP